MKKDGKLNCKKLKQQNCMMNLKTPVKSDYYE